MRKLTKNQVLARLFACFFAAGSLLYNLTPANSADYGTYTINGVSNTLTDQSIQPTNLSNNILEVNITAPTAGTTGEIYGAYSNEYDDNGVSSNSVTVRRSSDSKTGTYSIYGGYINYDGDAKYNIVDIASISVDGNVYGGYSSDNSGSIQNTVAIKSGSTITGDVYGGNSADKTGNTLIIDGSNNTIGGKLTNFEKLSFNAIGMGNGDSMLSLTTDTAFAIDAKTIEVAAPDLHTGEALTLISSTADNTFDENIIYKINGKQAIADGQDRYILNFASEDPEQVVHLAEFAYKKDGNNLNLCNDAESITALYWGKDAEDNPQNLGKAEMTISSVPQGVSRIYGAYSDVAEQTAGGVTISLASDNLDLSESDIVGSHNAANPTNIDTANSVLNVDGTGIKAKNINNFGSVNFKISSGDIPNLTVNRINLDKKENSTL